MGGRPNGATNNVHSFIDLFTAMKHLTNKLQAALERASVCLVNAEAVGTEILKSLVLPGLGNFTILDPAMVSLSIVQGERGFCNLGLLQIMNEVIRNFRLISQHGSGARRGRWQQLFSQFRLYRQK